MNGGLDFGEYNRRRENYDPLRYPSYREHQGFFLFFPRLFFTGLLSVVLYRLNPSRFGLSIAKGFFQIGQVVPKISVFKRTTSSSFFSIAIKITRCSQLRHIKYFYILKKPFIRFIFHFDTVLATMTMNDRWKHKYFLAIYWTKKIWRQKESKNKFSSGNSSEKLNIDLAVLDYALITNDPSLCCTIGSSEYNFL